MKDIIGEGFNAMRQLRLDCEQDLRMARAAGLIEVLDFPLPIEPSETYETPGGLEIVKYADVLNLHAEFEETNNGKNFDVDYEVEFPPDMREWPSVYRTTYVGARGNILTVPRKKFYEVAGLLSGLVVTRELASK
jgi:hypothetical protein